MKYLLTLTSFLLIMQLTYAQTDWPFLERYKAENKQLAPLAKGEKRVVFMGNSITEGWKDADSSFFAGKNYVDRGISGQTSSQMLLRFRQDVINIHASAVVINAGINDIAENTGPITVEEIFGNIKSMTELAAANHIKVIIASVIPANVIPWRMEIKPADKVIALNKLLKDYCTKMKYEYVDYYSSMVDAEKGLPKEYSEDGVHPNLKGYKIMETLVEKAIKKVLAAK